MVIRLVTNYMKEENAHHFRIWIMWGFGGRVAGAGGLQEVRTQTPNARFRVYSSKSIFKTGKHSDASHVTP